MRTYWFTIASGSKYREMADTLLHSCQTRGIDLHVLDAPLDGAMHAKRMKIEGILNAPAGFDRIVFIDADTIVLDPSGIDTVNGSWMFPWRIPLESSIPRCLDPELHGKRLNEFYLENGLSEFAPNGKMEGVEWNSGVIAGDREAMMELAREWAYWWDRVLALFDGHFRRDQVSFKLAYWNTFVRKYNHPGLPSVYNWCVSYFGINPNAKILHRNMIKGVPWLDRAWDDFAYSLRSGMPVGTRNLTFDLGPVMRVKPCLTREECRHFSLDNAIKRLNETIRQVPPENVLVLGSRKECAGFLECLDSLKISYALADQEEGIETLIDDRKWDFMIFGNLSYLPRVMRLFPADGPHDAGDPRSEQSALSRPSFIGCFFCAHHLEFYETLFRFSHVRFIDESFGLFSDDCAILDLKYDSIDHDAGVSLKEARTLEP